MLRRRHIASLAFSSLTLALVSGLAGCGSDGGGTSGSTSSSSSGSSGTGGESSGTGGGTGGTGGAGQGGAGGGQGGAGGVGGGQGGSGQGGAAGGGQGGAGGAPGCTPNTTQACYDGPAGTAGKGICKEGVQLCGADGKFGPCNGEVLPGVETCDNIDNDCNGKVDDGINCVCQPGMTTACYTGPAGTQDVGICKGGMQTCAADGSGYGPCVGQVLPAAETCNALDDNCNGMVDDGVQCACVPNTTKDCYDGPAGTAGIGICKAGKQTCAADGSGYGPCAGEVLPQPQENCATPVDDNCDGKAPTCSGNYQWAKIYGDTVAQVTNGVATDSQGNVVIIGTFAGAMNFGAPTGTLTSAGGTDVFVAKYDPSGTLLWAKQFGDAAAQSGNGIAVDSAGDILVTGNYQGKINFGAGPLTSLGSDDIFVAKLKADGSGQVWSKTYGNSVTQVGEAIAVDPKTNDVYVTGEYSGTNVSIVGAIALPYTDGYEVFVAKLNSAGVGQFQVGLTGTGAQYGLGLAVAPNGNVSLTGRFENKMADAAGTISLTSAGGSDVYLVQFTSELVPVWSKSFGDATATQGQIGWGVAVDPSGNTVITGEFDGTIDFGGGTLTAVEKDAFLAKFDGQGNHVWSKRYGTMSTQRGRAVATDSFGNILLTGQYYSGIDFGGGSPVNYGQADIFVAKLTPSATQVWLKGFGGGLVEDGRAIAVDPQNNVVFGGSIQSATNFGGGFLTPSGVLGDAFVAKLAP